MTTRAYTVLGWITWQIATRVAKRKMSQNKAKIGAAAATALGVLVAGLVAAKAAAGGEDS
jgi:hypothetical protein